MNLDTEFEALSVAEAAFYVRLGLQLEVFTLAEVSDWVDEIIWRESAPDTFFLKLYRLLRTDKPEIQTYLKVSFPGVSFSVRPAIGWLHWHLASGTRSLGQIVRSLYRLRTLVESDKEVGWIYGLAADYERATSTHPDTLREVKLETEEFLACYHDYTFANRTQWPQLDTLLEQRLANLQH
jgi:hypothetical protein